jgi:hypothetical protein
MAKKPITVAIFALGLSIWSTGLSGYQFWNSRRESRITTAVEISRNYLKDRDVETAALIFSINRDEQTGVVLATEQLHRIIRHFDVFEYVALLVLNDRLDRSYLSESLICDMAWTDGALERLKDNLAALPRKSTLKLFLQQNPCNEKIIPAASKSEPQRPPQSN